MFAPAVTAFGLAAVLGMTPSCSHLRHAASNRLESTAGGGGAAVAVGVACVAPACAFEAARLAVACAEVAMAAPACPAAPGVCADEGAAARVVGIGGSSPFAAKRRIQ